jgi:hypothetical protein
MTAGTLQAPPRGDPTADRARDPTAAAGAPTLLPRAIATRVALLVVGGWALARWSALLAGGDPALVLAAALGYGVALSAVRLPPRGASRVGVAVALVLVSGVVVLVLAGVPLHLLRPARWDQLSSGLSDGFSALPALRTPYIGEDEWPRSALLLLGGTALALGGALANARGRLRGVGLVVLIAAGTGALVGHPAAGRPALDAAVLLAGMAAWIALPSVPRGDRAATLALTAVVATAILAAAVAPGLAKRGGLLNADDVARALQPGQPVSFTFDHRYGPLSWTRDGREVLRVHASTPRYWKAVDLDTFDGRFWRASAIARDEGAQLSTELPADAARLQRWQATVKVQIHALKSRDVIAPGLAYAVSDAPSAPVSAPSPGRFRLEQDTRPGDSYSVRGYAPQPTADELRTAGTGYPLLASEYTTLDLEPARGSLPPMRVHFVPFGGSGAPQLVGSLVPSDAHTALDRSAYSGAWAIAQRLRLASKTPDDYVRAVLAFLAGPSFSYSENAPRAGRYPLAAFLSTARFGDCQHFSGAAALLLRMGGIPARVAAGFSPGAVGPHKGDYIVRDLDAHSWVEAYYPDIGWVTFDPTPAAAPRRGQTLLGLPSFLRLPSFRTRGLGRRGDAPAGRGAAAKAPGAANATPSPWPWVGLTLAVALALAGAVALAGRIRRPVGDGVDPRLMELERALTQAGLRTVPGTTFTELAVRLPEARPYLSALERTRFAGGPVPGPVERRALRAAVRHRPQTLAWIRAWIAVPPTLSRHVR